MKPNPNNAPPKIFVSYSWTTPEHEQWVYNLAERLRSSDGVDIKLDKWDLKEGYDKYAFMESMVTSPEIDKVLIICDKGYKEKANANTGGVGTEKLLITPEIMENVEQTKIIPIIAERDENGKEYMPNFIKSRIYIDLSDANSFEDNYEKLVRNIYNAPLYRKPSLGKRPVFLDEESLNYFKSTNIVRQISRTLESNPTRVKGLMRSFADIFIEDMKELELKYEDLKGTEIDETIVEKINASTPLRDNYLDAIKQLAESDLVNSEWIVELFERLYSFTELSSSGSYYEIQFDQYKFIIHELFLYTCAILIKYEQYQSLSVILLTDYLPISKYRESEMSFEAFRFHLASLESRNNRLGLRKISLHAQILVERVNEKIISKQELIDCDILLFYLSGILIKSGCRWFPITYIYREYKQSPIRFLAKLRSKRRAEQVFSLFNVTDIMQLRDLVQNYNHDDHYRFHGSHYGIQKLQAHIKPHEIGINP